MLGKGQGVHEDLPQASTDIFPSKEALFPLYLETSGIVQLTPSCHLQSPRFWPCIHLAHGCFLVLTWPLSPQRLLGCWLEQWGSP